MTFGTCTSTDDIGEFTLNRPIEQDAMFGEYEAEVHSIDFDIYSYTTFEVVSTILEADAHGPYAGVAGEPVSFFGDNVGGKLPYTWHWDFGDDESSIEQNPDHTYTTTGEYIATLTVTDNDGYEGYDTAIVTINAVENQPPSNPVIDGPTNGKVGETYEYTFSANDPDGDDAYFWVEWHAGSPYAEWIGPYGSGEEVTLTHTWDEEGTYTIRAKAKDVYNAESDWSTLEVTMPYVHIFDRIEQPFLRFILDLLQLLFERFAF